MKVQADPQIARLASGDMVLDALARRKARKETDARKCQATVMTGAVTAYCRDSAAWQIDMGTKVRTYACDGHIAQQIREYADYAASYGTTKATVRPL